jgi:hypothetical protein
LPDRKTRCKCEILVDRRYAGLERVDRRAEDDHAAVELDRALGGLVRARDDADQRRLAGAVVAADREDFTRRDLEVDAPQCFDRAVALADAGQSKQRRQGRSGGAYFSIWSTFDASTSTASIQRYGPLTAWFFGTFLTTMSFIFATAVRPDLLERNADGRGQQACPAT